MKHKFGAFWAALGVALLASGSGPAAARETVNFVTAIPLPGGQAVTAFDIGWVDESLGVYLLADRTNASIAVVDTATNQVINQLSAPTAPFVGASPAGNDHSGPDGVITVNGTQVWAGDGNSTIKVLDAYTGALVTVINTGGTARADELCLDPDDNLVMMANDADDPPFVTLISTVDFTIKAKIPFDGIVGPRATNGIEQCQYSHATGFFYVNIPEVNGPGNDTQPGNVTVVSPKTLKIVGGAAIPLANCAGPQGMAVGPGFQLAIGCNVSSSTVILDQRNVGTILATLANEGGADEIWYSPKDDSYYYANSAPSYSNWQLLGSVDATKMTRDVSTRIGIKNGVGGIAHGGNHSVAADPTTGLIYVPIASTSGSTWCTTSSSTGAAGCIAVFNGHGG